MLWLLPILQVREERVYGDLLAVLKMRSVIMPWKVQVPKVFDNRMLWKLQV